MLAMASDAIVIGFTVDVSPGAKRQAQVEGVDVRIYDVIYKVVEDIELAIQGMLEPEYQDKVIGRAEVKAVFRKTKTSVIAGLLVGPGKMVKGMNIRVYRGNEVVYEGHLNSLKRFQDDVREIEEGLECGIMLDGYNDLQEGDIIEGHEVVEVSKV
jgi:translation initiation factor IF-2